MVHEIRTIALGGRIEKVMQPERDEIILQLRSTEGGKRLLINGVGVRISPSVCSAYITSLNNGKYFCLSLMAYGVKYLQQ